MFINIVLTENQLARIEESADPYRIGIQSKKRKVDSRYDVKISYDDPEDLFWVGFQAGIEENIDALPLD